MCEPLWRRGALLFSISPSPIVISYHECFFTMFLFKRLNDISERRSRLSPNALKFEPEIVAREINQSNNGHPEKPSEVTLVCPRKSSKLSILKNLLYLKNESALAFFDYLVLKRANELGQLA